jgi:hypothetical protein
MLMRASHLSLSALLSGRFLLPLLAAAALAAPAAADISVSRNDEVWRVSADGESLQLVMTRLSEEAGFDLSRAERLSSGPGFDGELEGSLREIVERLMRGRDYAIVGSEDDPESGALIRIVVLSDRVGDLPVTSGARRTAETLPAPSAPTADESERVTALLQRQIQPILDADDPEAQTSASAASAASPASPPAQSSDLSDDELDAETQAALAEATRRAQADVQALANALRRHEESLRNNQSGDDQ